MKRRQKSLWLTPEQYDVVRLAAEKCGFKVGRGPGSGFGRFVVWAAFQVADLRCAHCGAKNGLALCGVCHHLACGEHLHLHRHAK